VLAALVPVVISLAMKTVFGETTRRFGAERGYHAGFAIYWATCWTLTGVIVGRRRLLDLWRLSGGSIRTSEVPQRAPSSCQFIPVRSGHATTLP
jgi:hypothetical protein